MMFITSFIGNVAIKLLSCLSVFIYVYKTMFIYLCLYICVYLCLSMFIYSFNQVNGDLVPRLALARSQVAGLSDFVEAVAHRSPKC